MLSLGPFAGPGLSRAINHFPRPVRRPRCDGVYHGHLHETKLPTARADPMGTSVDQIWRWHVVARKLETRQLRHILKAPPSEKERTPVLSSYLRSTSLLVVAVWLVSSPLVAATYYVDQGAAQASDQNPGSEAAPWKTISRAATARELRPATAYSSAPAFTGNARKSMSRASRTVRSPSLPRRGPGW